MSWWEGSPEPGGLAFTQALLVSPGPSPRMEVLFLHRSPPLPGEGGRKPSRASVRNGPMCPDFICASEPGEESLQPGGARGTEPPSFARALQVQRHPLATVT